jgi:hypothetical protein
MPVYVPSEILSDEDGDDVRLNRWAAIRPDGAMAFIPNFRGELIPVMNADTANVEGILKKSSKISARGHRVDFFPIVNITKAEAYLENGSVK